MDRKFPFDPAKASYSKRFTRSSRDKVKKDGTPGKMSGPYWYANWIEFGRLRTCYLGKDLPAECQPYAPDYTYIERPSEKPLGRVHIKRRGAADSILEALDRGEQVVIDVDELAKECKAYYHSLGSSRYVIYRDPE